MNAPEPGETLQLLKRLGIGDPAAERRLLELLYDELHRIARRHMHDQKPGHTLQPTALVHEAWLRLAEGGVREWEGRDHFLRLAARAMRTVLIDHYRGKASAKRGGGRAPLESPQEPIDLTQSDPAFVIDLHDALGKLGAVDPQLEQVAEMRLFGGMEHDQIAAVLGLSTRTIERAWRTARAVLQKGLAAE